MQMEKLMREMKCNWNMQELELLARDKSQMKFLRWLRMLQKSSSSLTQDVGPVPFSGKMGPQHTKATTELLRRCWTRAIKHSIAEPSHLSTHEPVTFGTLLHKLTEAFRILGFPIFSQVPSILVNPYTLPSMVNPYPLYPLW